MNLIYLKSALKSNSFDASIGIKIPILEFRLLLSRIASYLQLLFTVTVTYQELFDSNKTDGSKLCFLFFLGAQAESNC